MSTASNNLTISLDTQRAMEHSSKSPGSSPIITASRTRWPCAYGGEEFALILPNCGCDEAAAIAERVRRAVEIGPWPLRPVTVSLGAATMIHGTPDHAALIARADAAMYLAKLSGRNQVCCSNDVRDAALRLIDRTLASPSAMKPYTSAAGTRAFWATGWRDGTSDGYSPLHRPAANRIPLPHRRRAT